MTTVKKILNTQIKEQPASNGSKKEEKHEAVSPVASKLSTPEKSLIHKKAVERVFEKNSELFHHLAK